jgi:hypothetical protein
MSSRRLELDYIATAHRSQVAGLLLLAAAIAVAGFLFERHRDVRQVLDRIEARQGMLSERRPVRAAPREKLDEEAKSAEAVLRQLALPWASIIETVEDAASDDVAILQLQPDAQARQLRLGAEARTQEAMLEYLRKLTLAKGLGDVHIVNHQVQLDDPQRPIQFTVQATLKGAQ